MDGLRSACPSRRRPECLSYRIRRRKSKRTDRSHAQGRAKNQLRHAAPYWAWKNALKRGWAKEKPREPPLCPEKSQRGRGQRMPGQTFRSAASPFSAIGKPLHGSASRHCTRSAFLCALFRLHRKKLKRKGGTPRWAFESRAIGSGAPSASYGSPLGKRSPSPFSAAS